MITFTYTEVSKFHPEGKTYNETVNKIEFDQDCQQWFYHTVSGIIVTAAELVELGALDKVPAKPSEIKKKQQQAAQQVIIDQIIDLGLYAEYEEALPISYAPLSSQDLTGTQKNGIRTAYKKLNDAGISFMCGSLTMK